MLVNWTEKKKFDLYVEPIAFKIKILIKITLFLVINSSRLFNSNMRKSALINLVILS